jgi:DNA-binding MarR family transcriptional regulator
MPSSPAFTTQLLGQTEKAANAILERLLAEPGLTESQWVTLAVTAMTTGTLDHAELTRRVADTLKVDDPEAQARIAELAGLGLVHVPDDDAPVTLTDAGQRLHAEIRAATSQITQRLWGDLPAHDLTTAGRVLTTVLTRANAELAAMSTAR